MGPILFSSRDNQTRGLLVKLHLGLEGVTEVDCEVDRFLSLEVTPSNDRVHVASGHNTRQQLAGEHFFEGLQNHMENKNDGNESKNILRDFNWTMDEIVN